MLFCLLVDVNCFKKYVQLFPKAVNTVIEHFRGEGTLRGGAQPPCSRQGQLGGSGWITQGFGFESKALRMEPAQPVWAGCSNAGLSWSRFESFSFYPVGTTPVLIFACLSLPPLPTVKNLALHKKSPYLTLPSLLVFVKRLCQSIAVLQLSHLLSACGTPVLPFPSYLPNFKKVQSLSFLSKCLFFVINS